MAINGRINVDVLFHDTDGTTSLKVVSLEGATECTTGKVAIVTGTVGTTAVTLFSFDGQGIANAYKTASGQAVGIIDVSRIALRANGNGAIVEDGDTGVLKLFSKSNELAVGSNQGAGADIYALSGTASYTVVLYGT
jgi:hypothetical protein